MKRNYSLLVLSKDNGNGYIKQLGMLMRKPTKRIEEWFNEGKYCFAFAKDKKIISYFWLTLGARYHEFMGRDYEAGDEAFVHTALTVHKFRGKGLASMLLNEMLTFSKNNNIRKMHGFIVVDNSKSINSFADPLGFKLSRRKAVYLRLFNKEKYYVYE